MGKIIPLLENNGFIITVLEKDGRTDGEIHQRFDYKDQAFDLHANIWVAETFQPLLDWISCCN